MLEMIAKALAALSPPSPGSGVETKKCGVTVCKESLSVGRYDCTCGCGKSWCLHHGRKRKEAEMPGQQSHLVRMTREDVEREDGPSLCEKLGDLITEAGLKLVIKPPAPTDGGGKR